MFKTRRTGILAVGFSFLAILIGLPAIPAFAATASTTFQVTATVSATCSISASDLTFGTYSGAQLDGSTTLSVTCTNSTAYNVGLNAGNGAGATVSGRKMTGPSSATLDYALFQDSSHTINWGNTPGTDTKSGTGNGSAQSLTVFGRVAASQFPAPGAYSDTISATINF
jgi:spore coat protein U-like protein